MVFHLGLQARSHANLLFFTTAPMVPRNRSGFRRLCFRNCAAMDPKETRKLIGLPILLRSANISLPGKAFLSVNGEGRVIREGSVSTDENDLVHNFTIGYLPPKLVLEVKEKLSQYDNLPVGKNGRVDEEMILWFLKDRKFSVEDAVSKLTKAIRWRHEFGVSNLSEESVKSTAETGKAYLHDNFDVYGRPVLIVEASKHFPQDPYEDEKLCVFLIEKAISRFPAGTENILAIIDLRGFGTRNADIKFLTFLFDVFYYYYPRRLGEVLFVEAPFIFQPVWQLAKPMLKSYASLVRFCSVAEVRKEYFTEETIPASFRK